MTNGYFRILMPLILCPTTLRKVLLSLFLVRRGYSIGVGVGVGLGVGLGVWIRVLVLVLDTRYYILDNPSSLGIGKVRPCAVSFGHNNNGIRIRK